MSDNLGPSNSGKSDPQYGQRSESWTPKNEGQPNPGSGQDRPWPVYGQGAPAVPSPSGGSNPYPPGTQNGGGPTSPMMPGPAYGVPGPAGYKGPAGPMPSRVGAIVMLVVGVALMIPVPLVIFLSSFVISVDFTQISTGMTTNGGTVTVDDTGMFGVVGGTTLHECTLDNGTERHTLYSDVDGIVRGRGITPGAYTLDCGPEANGVELMLMPEGQIEDLFDGTVRGLIISTVVGLTGLGLMIGGIVWLVSRNRKRREYLRIGMY